MYTLGLLWKCIAYMEPHLGPRRNCQSSENVDNCRSAGRGRSDHSLRLGQCKPIIGSFFFPKMLIAAQVAYFAAIPKSDLAKSEVIVAGLFFRNVFGNSAGARSLPAFVCLSNLGNVLAVSFSQSRVNQGSGHVCAAIIGLGLTVHRIGEGRFTACESFLGFEPTLQHPSGLGKSDPSFTILNSGS
jgi:hypothetical protein